MSYTKAEIDQALSVLHNAHADVASSALGNNAIDISVDLQIIVPVYKVERYIEECINSILSQSTKYTYLVTIVNDGSPDRSREILTKYEGNKNIEIIDQENRGFSGARNRGFKTIKGRYVTFLDSDDSLANGAIDSLLDAAFKHDADIVQGGFNLINESSALINSYPIADAVSTDDDDSMLQGYPWGKAFRAELLKNVQFPEGYWFEDTICAYLLFPLAKTKCAINSIVYNYRRNTQGITHTSAGNPKCLDTLYITQALLSDATHFDFAKRQHFYSRQFQQIRCNFNRIISLGDEQINKAAFIIHCSLIEQYFNDYSLSNDSFAKMELEKAIKSHNYPLYRLANLVLN